MDLDLPKRTAEILSAATFMCCPVSLHHEEVPFHVITSCLIFRLSPPNFALQFLCVVGFCLGIAIFLRGLRSRRTRVLASGTTTSISSRTKHSAPQRSEEVVAPLREIIHLSSDYAPMKSAEMTQQQKIAAALARAGTSHSTARVHESTGVAVETGEPDPFEHKPTPILRLVPGQLTPRAKSSDISHLLIWCGLALAVLSCYLLVAFH